MIPQETLHGGHEHIRILWLGHEHSVPAGAINRAVPAMQHEGDAEFFEPLAQFRAVTIGEAMVEHRSGQIVILNHDEGLAKCACLEHPSACAFESSYDFHCDKGLILNDED